MAVISLITTLNNKLNGCSIEQEGEDFFIIGADAVRKKLGESIAYLAGTVSKNTADSVTIDCTGMDGYQYLTVNNFFLSDIICYASRTAGSMANDSTTSATTALSYNSKTGVFTVSNKSSGGSGLKAILYSFKVWVIPGVTRS